MKNKSLKLKLNANQLTIGTWVTISSPKIIEILANYNFDWICIDIEHNFFNNESITNLIRTIQSFDIAALVRVDDNEPVIIKKCLDSGADGLIIPMVNTPEEAKNAVSYSYYANAGNRGVGLSRAQNYGLSFNSYKDWLKENLVIIAQIEHYQGIENLEEIVDVEGIDAVFIGPNDLSSSLGFPGELDHPEMVKQLKTFREVCKKKKVPFGEHLIYPKLEDLRKLIDDGLKFIVYGVDFNFLIRGISDNYDQKIQ